MTRCTVRASRRGMTLLEVIVALTIAGSALASGAAVLGFLADQQTRTGSQALVSASAVRRTIRAWTSQARLATEGDAEFRGAPHASAIGAMRQEGDSDELVFVTAAPTAVSESGTIVRLHVAAGERADSVAPRGLVADLRPWRQAGAPVTIVLAPDATSLRVRYVASLSGRQRWLDSWVTTSVLPAAMELRVTFDSSAARGEDRAARALLATPFIIPLSERL